MDTESNINKEKLIIELESEITEAEKVVELHEDLKWLMKQKQFKSVIIDGYIGELAEFLFNELTKSITLQAMPEDQLKEGLLAIRHLKSYIGFDGLTGDVEYNAMRAKDAILSCEEQLIKL